MPICAAVQAGEPDVASTLVKTDALKKREGRSPGIFERTNEHGVRTAYVAIYYDGRGRQRKVSAKTLKEVEKKRESRKAIIHADEMAPVMRQQQAINVALALGYEVALATQPMR